MRILVDIRHLGPKQSGVGEYTTQLLRALFEIDHENEYVLFSSGTQKPPEEIFALTQNKRWTHLHLPTPNKLLNLRTLFLKHPTINWRVREPIDLIFLPNLNITALPNDIPTVLTIHDLSWHFYPEFYSRKMQLWHKVAKPAQLIAQARTIITPSTSTKQDVHAVFGKDENQIVSIAHGVDTAFHAKMEARDHGVRSHLKLPKQFALYVGTIEPRKNLLGLVEGIKQYRDRTHQDLHLVLAGKWGWRSHDLRRRLWKRDVSGWIHQTGYLSKEDLGALYRSAAIFTWPSLYEGFGLPVLEAMRSGTPVLTSHTSSLPEITNGAAVLIDPYNTTDISEALRGILGSNTLQKQMRDRGIARANEFSWTVTAQKTLEVFKKSVTR